MRIAFLARRFDPLGGGTERDLLVTCRCLLEAGHEVIVYAARIRGFSNDFSLRRVFTPKLGRAFELFCFGYFAPPLARRSGSDLIISFGRTVDADIQRCGGGVYLSYLKAARQWRSKTHWWMGMLSPYRRLQLNIERKGFSSPRLICALAVSESVKREIRENFGLPCDKVVTLYNGVDLEHFKPSCTPSERARLRQDLGINEEAKVIIFVGNGFARKGLGYLIRAIALIRDTCHLYVAGRDRERKSFENLARGLGLRERVTFLGPTSDVSQLYKAADVLVLPSLYEAFGNVVLEAMACGVPAVVSAEAGVAEIFPNGLQDLLIRDPTNVDEIAYRIKIALHKPAELSHRVREVAEQFTWQRYSTQFLHLIENWSTIKRRRDEKSR